MKLNPVKQKVYKVLLRDSGSLTSCVACGQWEIRYPTDGSLVRPLVANTSLFVFTRLRYAQDFLMSLWMNNGRRGCEIWEAEAYNAKPIHWKASVYSLKLQPEMVLQSWKDKAFWAKTREVGLSAAPRGSARCSSLKLVKQVYLTNGQD